MRNVLLSLLMCGALSAGEIRQYATRLDLAPDGTAQATATVTLAGTPGETLELPIGFKASGVILTAGPQGLRLEPAASGVRVTLPPGEATFTFTYHASGVFAQEPVAEGEKATLPASSRMVRHTFVNTREAVILDYSVLAILPSGYRVQAIREQLPKVRKTEIEPRVRLGKADGRQTAFLHTTGLKQGDDASMVLEAVPNHRSLLWLAAGLAIALLYLYYFRDSIRPKP